MSEERMNGDVLCPSSTQSHKTAAAPTMSKPHPKSINKRKERTRIDDEITS